MRSNRKFLTWLLASAVAVCALPVWPAVSARAETVSAGEESAFTDGNTLEEDEGFYTEEPSATDESFTGEAASQAEVDTFGTNLATEGENAGEVPTRTEMLDTVGMPATDMLD
ncbi:MAG: hypothetical protein ACLR9K_04295, partial [Blautia sp.]